MLTEKEKQAITHHYNQLSQNLTGFRARKSQRIMLAEIAKTFAQTLTATDDQDPPKREGESILLIEGPTGVGKSLAYLLAGTIMAQMRDKKLIVSSATIALQEQLVFKDLPSLAKNSGLSFTYALAKGRGRYLCPYRLYQITQANAQQELLGFDRSVLLKSKIEPQERILFQQIADEFEQRQFNGDKDSWHEGINDVTWMKINNDRHSCLKNNCPNKPECPFFLARDTLDNVDVVVVNHDLLLADVSLGGGVILPSPAHSFYCLDEAHHFPKKAIKQFAAEHGLTEAKFILEKVTVIFDRIAAVADKADLANQADEAVAFLVSIFSDWESILNQNDFFPESKYSNESVWLWDKGQIPEELAEQVKNTAIGTATLMKLVYKLEEAINQARRKQETDAQEIDKIILDFGFYLTKLEQIDAVWALMQKTTEENEIPLAKWLTLDRKDKADYIFHASPVSSATQLAHHLWSRVAGAVLTSATLRSLGNFDLILQQTGLNLFPKTAMVSLDSPFNYPSQAELYIPPLNNSPKFADAHTQEVAQWLPKLIDINHPTGTLVLFSSRKQMREVAERLDDSLLPLLLIQGDIGKSKLIAQHQENIDTGKASIIFGMDSFAEGLDLPGNACIQVIIAKLPFAMPDNPVDKTLSEWISSQGGNPFMEITVPETAVKLLQAVGRLIRTETDYGRITIMDNRVLTAAYGKRILASLPEMKRI